MYLYRWSRTAAHHVVGFIVSIAMGVDVGARLRIGAEERLALHVLRHADAGE